MRLILKILVAPIIVVLTLFVWICSGLLYCSSFILGLAGTVLGILGVLVLLTGAVTNGIIVLVMAFLVSPFESRWRWRGRWLAAKHERFYKNLHFQELIAIY